MGAFFSCVMLSLFVGGGLNSIGKTLQKILEELKKRNPS